MSKRKRLLQERYAPDPWPVLVVSMLLKMTQGRQVEPLLDRFFKSFPNPEDLLGVDEDKVRQVIKPLGLWRQRAGELRAIARRLVEEGTPGSKEEAKEIHGVGEYVSNAYSIFVLGDRSVEPEDDSLKRYLAETSGGEG